MSPIEEVLETEAIRKLRVLYSHYYDGERLDDLVGLFTEDAICELGPDFGGDWVGQAQIRANFSRYLEQSEAWTLLLDRLESVAYAPDVAIPHQPGIMLGTLALKLRFTRPLAAEA